VLWKFLSGQTNAETPRIPRGVRVYAVGDIHGRADLLKHTFSRIDLDTLERRVTRPIEVYLGDYIDRGPDSRDVLEQLIARSKSREIVCLKGNHETFPLQFAADPGSLRDWAQMGGLDTLISYGLRPPVHPDAEESGALATAFGTALPSSHRRFLTQLVSHLTCGDFFFVHAGVRPGIPLRAQQEADLLWIREDFLQSEDDHGKIIVHGHTPVLEPEFWPNRINIDTGAYATGRLTCLIIEGDKLSFL
jgi:serine/threonine protein phosphatase 1